MRVLVTGDRNWTDGVFIEEVLKNLAAAYKLPYESIVLVHGNARGADKVAAHRATLLGFGIEAYPAKWDEHGRAAGPIRNQQMLMTGVDLCLAFHNDIDSSKGTRDMIGRCAGNGVPTVLYGQGRQLKTWNW